MLLVFMYICCFLFYANIHSFILFLVFCVISISEVNVIIVITATALFYKLYVVNLYRDMVISINTSSVVAIVIHPVIQG